MAKRFKLRYSIRDFIQDERFGGILIISATILSLVLANWGGEHNAYLNFWHHTVGEHTAEIAINDVLMSFFFLAVGIELKRELTVGELNSWKSASLPFFSALGGMLVPALIYVIFNFGTSTISGFGIPTATDIAFAVAILSLLGDRIPYPLKVFLIALAVIDDLGAILLIATCYSSDLDVLYLLLTLALILLLIMLNQLNIFNATPYLIIAIGLWLCLFHSGIHPTLTGVIVAFAYPTKKAQKELLSEPSLHFINRFNTLLVLPIFALFNTIIPIHFDQIQADQLLPAFGIFGGLVAGKPLGIFLFSFFSVKAKWAEKPGQLKWMDLFGACILGGIGFTMSIFVTNLSFTDVATIEIAKIAIIMASLLAATVGFIWLFIRFRKNS